jgi:hypothetical protein
VLKDAPERLLAGVPVVHNRAMEEVRYYYHREKLLFLSILPPALLAHGIYMVLNPQTYSHKGPGHAVAMGIMSIMFALCFGLWISFRLLSTKPAIIIGPEGITDGTVWNALGFVPWTNVISVTQKHKGWVEIFVLPDNRLYPTTLWKTLMKMAIGSELIRVPVGLITGPGESFTAVLRTYMESARDTQPPG